ncbi:hypothetical protein [Legionella jamestowniensis]|uniref:Uncharacterized protein n=1 Tax=Legionella jamestowniensis TaxID=455 RepID=A0A0W0UJN9_9GAMM|nr:hypothetical protein [Legionella jamestowniensis]KTD08037.1 hypothetical protein Ljam_2232 [Legionella jamestowniensis]OCH97322.1 hypothetical protein A8135_03435 [Legionella jamestowniensis]SFM06234.1 hypothetical protein SAMN02746073_0200 [Legionella jamestowniensis DSM 19215]
MKITVKYFPSAWTFESKDYNRWQIEQRIELSLLNYVNECKTIFPEKYHLLEEIVFTVSNHVAIGDNWSFDFYERGEGLLKNALINPRNLNTPIISVYENPTHGDEESMSLSQSI